MLVVGIFYEKPFLSTNYLFACAYNKIEQLKTLQKPFKIYSNINVQKYITFKKNNPDGFVLVLFYFIVTLVTSFSWVPKWNNVKLNVAHLKFGTEKYFFNINYYLKYSTHIAEIGEKNTLFSKFILRKYFYFQNISLTIRMYVITNIIMWPVRQIYRSVLKVKFISRAFK